MLKKPKIRSEKHRRFVASLECAICGLEGMTQAAHIRTGNGAGISLKSGDDNVLPLCCECHRVQHLTSEKLFYGDKLESAKTLAKTLYQFTGNRDAAIMEIVRFRDR